MEWLHCPIQGCGRKFRIHHTAPDSALVDIMWHFLYAHPEQDPLALLDSTDEIKV